MLSCAGAYVSGADGSNACPAGSVRIETEAACRTAVAAAGKTFRSVDSYPYFPRGCFYADNAYFNVHAVGFEGATNARLLCATTAVTAGAPTA